ncbi:MAG TPA: hypothetical protein VGO49_21225 [Bradyrhizobium sp.]|jgi:hypothetical protein|nr:hypothetical protein [Bradyrhizobium sp.]
MEWLGRTVGQIAGFFWSLFRILWVCRVAALSAIGGGLLIALVEQARDLFADTGLSRHEWLFFFVMLFLWAWLVHGMARRALQFDEWVPQAHRLGGLSIADRTTLQKQYWFVATWIPRLLGLIVFIATAWALWLTRANLLHATDLEQVRLAIALNRNLTIATIVAAAAYLVLVFFRRSLWAHMTGRSKDAPLLIGAQSVLVLEFRAAMDPWKNWPALRASFNSRFNQILFGVIFFVVTAIFLVAIIWPDLVSDRLPRVMFLPLLLGGAILLLGEIASLSHRYATPLLLCFFVAGGLLGYYLKHYNDVRWVAPVSTPTAANGTRHQLGIHEAIERWKADNCRSTNDCPRPIVIAGAGGASRAGFYTASLVGAIIDAGMAEPELGDIRSRIFALSTVSGSSVGAVMMRAAWMDAFENNDLSKPPCKETATTAWFRSGDTQHKSEARPTTSWRDCFQLLMAGDFLSPIFVGLTYRDLFPLGNLRTGIAWGEDRSGLLEQSLERWYHRITGSESHACVDGDNSGLCRRLGHLPDRSKPPQAGQWIPLLFVNGTSVSSGRRIIASDVRIGCIVGDPLHPDDDRRFLDLAYDYRELRDPSVRQPQSRDDQKCDQPIADGAKKIDMRMSTVAMMSARFPLVSTQGVIRDLNDNIADSVVDGGYFENEGLATAADIVGELQNFGLHPVVIRIVNEPDEKIDDLRMLGGTGQEQQNYQQRTLTGVTRRDGEDQLIRPPLPKPGKRAPFDVYTSIGRALYATRSGHEEGHLAYLRDRLRGPLVRIGVNSIDGSASPALSPQARKLFCRSPVQRDTTMDVVSMSWWMSQSVQVYLDAQLCRPQIERLMCVLKLKGNESDDNNNGCG